MIKRYLKCDAARALFPNQRAVGYPDVIRNEGFVGVNQVTLLSPLRLYIRELLNASETRNQMTSLTVALNSDGKKGGLLVPRIASQALAEEWWVSLFPFPKLIGLPKNFYYLCADKGNSSGRVFLFTRADKEPGWDWRNPRDNTWVGWEYPALTRNPAVTEIVRIDPRPGEDNTPLIIWKREFGPTANPPRGADESVTDDRI